MKRNLTLLLLVLQITFLQFSCKKDNSAEQTINYPAGWLVKTINNSTYTYDSRNRLVQINRQNVSDSASVQKFTYDNDKVVKIEAGDGSYQQLTYTGDKVTNIKIYGFNGVERMNRKITYDAQGRLFQIDENDFLVIRTTKVTYGADGLPAKMVVTDNFGANTITTVFKSWSSDEADFNPYIVAEFMSLDTSPLLFAGLTKLPLSIEQTKYSILQADVFQYNITARKLTSMVVYGRRGYPGAIPATSLTGYSLTY